MKRILPFFVFAALLFTSGSTMANITYNFALRFPDRPPPDDSGFTGTITTDGTMGSIYGNNIIAYDVLFMNTIRASSNAPSSGVGSGSFFDVNIIEMANGESPFIATPTSLILKFYVNPDDIFAYSTIKIGFHSNFVTTMTDFRFSCELGSIGSADCSYRVPSDSQAEILFFYTFVWNYGSEDLTIATRSADTIAGGIPEPETWMLFLIGAAANGLILAYRQRLRAI
jgi:hypothetical protein